MRSYEGSFPYIYRNIGRDLLKQARRVEVPTWHAQDVTDNPLLVSYEFPGNVSLTCQMNQDIEGMQEFCQPQLPWAEDHFQERVSGIPMNPPPSAAQWQTAGVADKHRTVEEDGEMVYSHTYPERFWPQRAGVMGHAEDGTYRIDGRAINIPHYGIRFRYGDLGDVVNLLDKEPLTRQAFLPVWFPEDTGAHHGGRVPCSLGYHFMIREDEVDITYMIRSVDYVRHFKDDVYMAMRLGLWMREELKGRGHNLANGILTMHVMSMHFFEGDRMRMERDYGSGS